MSIKLELDADSIKQAISAHIASQGFNLDGKHVDVALVNGRGGNGNRATVTITERTTPLNTVEAVIAFHPEVEEVVIIDETVVIAPDDELLTRHAENIISAAENSGDEGLFPKVDPTEVQTSKSLF